MNPVRKSAKNNNQNTNFSLPSTNNSGFESKFSNGVKIITKAVDKNQRLDKFLIKKIKNQSRSQIQKMIKRGEVLVNEKPVKAHYFLKANDVVEIETRDKRQETSSKDRGIKNLSPVTYHLSPEIVFENKNLLILDKPSGLLVHPTEKEETDTLVDWLIKKYPTIKNVGENKYRAGIVHRLDKDVSGIMIVPKNKTMYDHLKDQFKNRKIKKEYWALVYGRVQDQKNEIDLPIGRNKEGQFVAHPRQGKEKFQTSDRIAKTKYQVLEYLKDYTLLMVEIITGRTHQIRAHLSAIGHPIVGDQIYKPRKKFFHFLRSKIKVVEPGRIMLHSTKIGFNDLKNQWQEFSSPLPKKITQFINDQKTK